ncbi:hypothetical protein LMB98_09405 [Limosilactobacillus reuteri]|uniref:hypothetical protein n=1 Tax=Limosilactobacillus reuteri TaxID=1598 RepID=UPI001E4AFD12|nr:hypothetical protein [Limosilactobacillus reuteri]MCC4398235.1 hypothetical protein [Limosilactobacillus reuteri]MCC4409817.1 hypothetical protein [Limosilactobacillus reuteri]
MNKKRFNQKLFDCEEIKVSKYKGNKNIQKYSKIFIISLTLLILVIILFHIYKELINIFFDKNGDFQWVGITSIVAILTFGYFIYSTNKKNRYDVVSKERIRWIDDVKQQITELLVLMNAYYDIV